MSNENDETKTLDLKANTNRINSDEFLFYANPKINLGSQMLKACTNRINSDDGCSKEIKSEKSVDWILVKILGCPIIDHFLKPKLEVKEILKNKSNGMDQSPDLVDPRISINKENSDELIFNANPKINLGSQKLKASTDRINSDDFQEYANPKISSHEENMDYLHNNIEISNDIKSKLDVEQEPMDLYLQDI